jgi:hypothetical protein
MPTTAIGAVLYIFLLFPGIAFVRARERHRPILKRSVLRETASIVLVSAVCLGSVLVLVLVGGFYMPGLAQWLRNLAIDSNKLLAQDSQLFFSALLGILLASIVLGWTLGTKPVDGLWRRMTSQVNTPDLELSAWGMAFLMHRDTQVNVALQLKSGISIEGDLFSWDKSGHDEPTRGLVLTGDVKFKMPGSKNVRRLEDATVVVQASEIDFMSVTHYAIKK